MSLRLKAYIYLLLSSLIWGLAGPVIKYTLKFISPFLFLFWRFLITTLIYLPIFFIFLKRKKIRLTFNIILKSSLLGLVGIGLSLTLFFLGLTQTSVLECALIYLVAPLLVVGGGAIFLKEKVTLSEKIGVTFAFFGSLITIIEPFINGRYFKMQNFIANFLIFLSALTWAIYCLFVRKLETKEKINPFILTSIGFFSSFLFILPFMVWEKNSLQLSSLLFNPKAFYGIFYLSFFSSAIAYFIYNLGYNLIEASEATLFDYLMPLFGAPVSIFWLGEKIKPYFLFGLFFILLGVFLTEVPHKFKK